MFLKILTRKSSVRMLLMLLTIVATSTAEKSHDYEKIDFWVGIFFIFLSSFLMSALYDKEDKEEKIAQISEDEN